MEDEVKPNPATPVTGHDYSAPEHVRASATFATTGGGGDPPATSVVEVEAAFLRHAPALLRYLYARTRRVQDAEDLLVDTFVHARRYGKPIVQPGAWLYTVARRCATRHLARRRRETAIDPTDERGGLSGGTAFAPTPDHHRLDRMAPEIVAFLALAEGDREILLIHGLDERPMAEVAALLGVPEATAWQRWQRARNRYFDHLVAVGVRPSEAWRRPRRAGHASGSAGEDAVTPVPSSSSVAEEGGRHEL